MAKKAKDAFRTISEVADWLDVPAHVLRFWESKFTQIKPVKRAGGRRYYRPSDMLLIGGIQTLLHDQGITIRGVQKRLKEEGVDAISALSRPLHASTGSSTQMLSKTAANTEAKPHVDAADKAAPFVDVPEDTAVGGDNVLEISQLDRSPQNLTEPPAELKTEAPTEKSHVETVPNSPEAVETIEKKQISAPPELALEATQTHAPAMPNLDQIVIDTARQESLKTIRYLRRWNPANMQNRDQIAFLEHRARSLRDRMANALKNL